MLFPLLPPPFAGQCGGATFGAFPFGAPAAAGGEKWPDTPVVTVPFVHILAKDRL
jgi:hypothetical protein